MTNKTQKTPEKKNASDDNRDPISGTPGAHPVGTGVGATGGGLAGAAVGAVAGPVGAAVGLVAGAIAGGLAGKGVAEKIDPTAEDAYWKTHYAKRPYVGKNATFDTYQPAYRVGYEGRGRYPGKQFDEVEEQLRQDYEKANHGKGLRWDEAKGATRDAWNRLDRPVTAGSKCC